jgi:nitroreductase
MVETSSAFFVLAVTIRHSRAYEVNIDITQYIRTYKQGLLMKIWIITFCLFAVTFVSAQMKPKAAESVPADTNNIVKQESNIWDVFKDRRSVRKFTSDSIPEADLNKILDAARMAPTSGNQQPWKFLVVRDRNKINQMKEACVMRVVGRYDKNTMKETKEQFEEKVKTRFGNYFSAPVYVIVLTDNKSMYPDYNHWDGPLAAGYLMLAARALGYGTVFITDAIPESVTKEVLGIPDTYTRVCITPLGIPVEWPQSPSKKKLEEFILNEKF